jgi:probable HAF family extracellular repeat protein
MSRSCIACCVLSLSTVASAATTLTNLGSLGGVSYGYGISGDGLTAVGNANNSLAFRWQQPTGMVALGSGVALATNFDGTTTVGTNNYSGAGTAVRWDASGRMHSLGVTTSQTNGSSGSTGVSSDGSVIVGNVTSGTNIRAFRWTSATGAVLLDDGGGGGSGGAYGVSLDGSVTVGGDGGSAVRWLADGSRQVLGNLVPGWYSNASACSADGSVVVGGGNTGDQYGNRAFRWTATSGMIDLGVLETGWTYASGVSADGSVVVGESAGRAFVWSARTGIVDLAWALSKSGVDLQGLSLGRALGISADGHSIVGGAGTAWMISGFDINSIDVPAPSAAALLALVGLTTRGRRRK